MMTKNLDVEIAEPADGPIREIYHKGDWVTNDPDEYTTEIQVPIK